MEWIVPALVCVYLLSGVRVVSEAERIAVHGLGRFVGFKESGLRYRLPGTPKVWSRLALGMRGEVLSPELGLFGGGPVPIRSQVGLRQGQFVRIEGFSEASAVVGLDAVQTRTLSCQRCGHENELV